MANRAVGEKAIKIGEVIEARTEEFQAECDHLHQPPPLGSLVRAREGEVDIYAAVSGAATGSREPGRYTVALGRGEEREEEVYRAHPQLDKLMRTTFTALVAGHGEAGKLHPYLPPRPARIHSFVYLCPQEEVWRFTQSLDFLSLLLAPSGARDEALGACLRRASQAHPDPHAFLVKAGKELAVLLAGESGRLHALLKRLRP